MDFPLDLQKICEFGSRKLLLWMATIASIFFIVQFLSNPYGTVFLSSRKLPLIGKPVYLAPPKSDIYNTSTSAKANASQSGHSSSENRGILPASPSMASSTHGKKDPSLSNSIISGNNNTLSRVIKPETVPSGRPTSKSKTNHNGSLERPLKPVTSIAEMKRLLPKSRSSSRSSIPRWPSVPDQEILFAKSQIEDPPIVNKDPQLYAPLFHNVSTFKSGIRFSPIRENTLQSGTIRHCQEQHSHCQEQYATVRNNTGNTTVNLTSQKDYNLLFVQTVDQRPISAKLQPEAVPSVMPLSALLFRYMFVSVMRTASDQSGRRHSVSVSGFRKTIYQKTDASLQVQRTYTKEQIQVCRFK